MRFNTQFKNYCKPLNFIRNFPVRILKFKHTKWKKVQNILNQRKAYVASSILLQKEGQLHIKKKNIFFNNLSQTFSYKHLSNIQLSYKQSLELKRSVFIYYDQLFLLQHFKRKRLFEQKDKRHLFLLALIEPLFRLDVLLWKIGIFESLYSARHHIYKGLININFKKINQTCFLKKNDIITFSKVLFYETILRNFEFFSSFLEYDVYSNSLIIFKNLLDLSELDLYTIISRPLYIRPFINYLKSK